LSGDLQPEIAVIGASLGGVLAAWRAAQAGRQVLLVAQHAWLGGQMTAQAVPPDEHLLVELGGASRSYLGFREDIRAHYRKQSGFLDAATPQDRVVVVQSFSKSFLMTGWRLGWMVMPPAMTQQVGKLLEFNSSGAPVFVQRAAIVALERTDEVTPRVVAHMRLCRDTLVPLLQALPGVALTPARGGMYAFFRLPGSGDSLETAKRLVREAGLGLAPGVAFGAQDEASGSWLRWCFASRDPQRLVQGVDRLQAWLQRS
jgi:aspartate/methionine/tyrosine aminotransferase